MTERQLTKLIHKTLDTMQTDYINYQIATVKHHLTPLTFVEWVKLQNKLTKQGS